MADENKPRVARYVTEAFPDDAAPGQLSVGIVSLVELCQHAMPSPSKVRAKLDEAEFVVGDPKTAQAFADLLALENKLIAKPISHFRHTLYRRQRQDEPVVILVSEGVTDDGRIIMCSALFAGAAEADVVKAAAHVSKLQPVTGTRVENMFGQEVRRVMWEIPGTAGIRFLVAAGPGDMDATDKLRAITAINKAS